MSVCSEPSAFVSVQDERVCASECQNKAFNEVDGVKYCVDECPELYTVDNSN